VTVFFWEGWLGNRVEKKRKSSANQSESRVCDVMRKVCYQKLPDKLNAASQATPIQLFDGKQFTTCV
jgi:hypothetical protein